jgi:hypothetical protein
MPRVTGVLTRISPADENFTLARLSIEGLQFLLGDKSPSVADLPEEGSLVTAEIKVFWPKGKKPSFWVASCKRALVS